MRREMFIIGIVVVIAIVVGWFIFVQNGGTFDDLSSPSSIRAQSVSVPFTELARGTQSDITTRVNYLITASSELEELWKLIGGKDKAPVIDFSKSAVAAVFAGEKPTTGYAVTVSKVEDTNVRTVTVLIQEPGDNCEKNESVTKPYSLIEIPKTSLTFTHEDQTTTVNCEE